MNVAALPPPNLNQQIAELERELNMRRSVFPRLVFNKQLRQFEADYRMRCLDAAIETLKRVMDPARPGGRT